MMGINRIRRDSGKFKKLQERINKTKQKLSDLYDKIGRNNERCPRCDSPLFTAAFMTTYSVGAPTDTIEGDCLDCGFAYHTRTYFRTLYKINEDREEYELPRLTRRKEAVEGWEESPYG